MRATLLRVASNSSKVKSQLQLNKLQYSWVSSPETTKPVGHRDLFALLGLVLRLA